MEPIVVGVDTSPHSFAALRWGAGLGAVLGVPVQALSAIELPQIVGRAATLEELTSADQRRHDTETWLRELIRGECGTIPAEVQPKAVVGHPVHMLVAASEHAAAIVVGARGAGGFSRLLLGSVTSGVVHHAHSPVVVVRGESARPGRNVVVGVDYSDAARHALAWATDYARRTGGTLTIVNTWDWPTFQEVPILYGTFDPRRAAKELVEQSANDSGLPDNRLRTVVAKGSPAHALLEQSTDADLLVVGSHGRGGFAGMLLGSVSSQCVQHATCPVAVIRTRRTDTH